MPLFREYKDGPSAFRYLPNHWPHLYRNYPDTEGKCRGGAQIRPKVTQTPCFIEKTPGEARLPPLNSIMNLSGLPTRFLLGGRVLPKK